MFTKEHEDNNTFITLEQVMPASSFVRELESKPVNLDKACGILDIKTKTVDACCIDDEYDNYIIDMPRELDRQLNYEKLDVDIIVIDSYGAAEHRQTNKDRTSIIYFSSQLLTISSVAYGFSTSNFLSILTWQ